MAPSSRVLAVSALSEDGLDIIAVAAHAPTEAANEEDRQGFWELLASTLLEFKELHPRAMCVVLLDANGRLKSDGSARVGGLRSDRPTENGNALLAFAHEHGLVLSSTFVASGPTWFSPEGVGYRIDYVLACEALASSLVGGGEAETDLSIGARQDHVGVFVVFSYVSRGVPARPVVQARVSPLALKDPYRCWQFAELASSIPVDKGSCLDERVGYWTSECLKLALRVFGATRNGPKKPWISETSWALVRWTGPLHRAEAKASGIAAARALRIVFLGWASCKSSVFVPGAAPLSLGWHALSRLPGEIRVSREVVQLCSLLRALREKIAWRIRAHLVSDRAAWISGVASEASVAAAKGDTRACYALVKGLAGKRFVASAAPLLRPCGGVTTSDRERAEVLRDHFADVHGGRVLSPGEVFRPCIVAEGASSLWCFSSEGVCDALAALSSNKSPGTDGLSVEVLRAGGTAVANALSGFYNEVLHCGRWPREWVGAKLVALAKKSGSSEPNQFRGITILNHAAKALVASLAREVSLFSEPHQPACQYGAGKGKGCDYASHILGLYVQRARRLRRSYAVIFIDVIKAFDRAVRELVMGWPPGIASPEQHLAALGLTAKQSQFTLNFIGKHRCLLEQWGVPPHILGLVNSYHANAWASVPGAESAFTIPSGGRQGCPFGSIVFTSCYSVALLWLEEAILEAGVGTTVSSAGPGWACPEPTPGASGPGEVSCSHITFVDDEAIFLEGKSVNEIDHALSVVLTSVLDIFAALRLDISFEPNKTEALLWYAGKGASKATEARRCPADGRLYICLPGNLGRLRVVGKYVHLGGVFTNSGRVQAEAIARARAAREAYGPLASRFFGAKEVPRSLKVQIMFSLVVSRLLCKAHILVPTLQFLATISEPYMRCLRKIANDEKYGPGGLTDLQVREKQRAPSIDCLLRVQRLKYLRRIVIGNHPVLRALLDEQRRATASAGRPQPKTWVQLIEQDVKSLPLYFAQPRSLPTVEPGTEQWSAYIASPLFLRAVTCVHYTQSELDVSVSTEASTAASVTSCDLCGKVFGTVNGMRAHVRFAHRRRTEHSLFAPETGVCMVCKGGFVQRFRLIRHLVEQRTSCWASILEHPADYTPLAVEEALRLDEADRKATREAKVLGRSRPALTGPARRQDGRLQGVCRS